jgi:hypothetical protein
MSNVAEYPIGSSVLVTLSGVHLESTSLDGTIDYIDSGVVGTATLIDSNNTTLAQSSSWTHIDGSDGVWYTTLSATSDPSEGDELTLVIVLTSPSDDRREIPCVAVYRSA